MFRKGIDRNRPVDGQAHARFEDASKLAATRGTGVMVWIAPGIDYNWLMEVGCHATD